MEKFELDKGFQPYHVPPPDNDNLSSDFEQPRLGRARRLGSEVLSLLLVSLLLVVVVVVATVVVVVVVAAAVVVVVVLDG